MAIMESLLKDVRYGLRSLLKRRGFTTIAVITLALGIGANTAIFSVINAVLLRPLPFHNAEELVTLWERNPKQGYEQNPPAAGNYVDWRDQNRIFTEMAIYAPSKKFNLALEDYPERITGAAVSTSLFELLGVRPVQGRTFSSEEAQPGNDQVALISQVLSQRHFAADGNPVGRMITLDGKNYTIVGVMPEGFQFPGGSGTVLRTFTPEAAEVWVPLALDADTLQQRSSHSLNVIGRLKPGITVAQATAEMDAIQQRLEQQYPTFLLALTLRLFLSLSRSSALLAGPCWFSGAPLHSCFSSAAPTSPTCCSLDPVRARKSLPFARHSERVALVSFASC